MREALGRTNDILEADLQSIRILGLESDTPILRAGIGNIHLLGTCMGATTVWVMTQALEFNPMVSLSLVAAVVFLLLRLYSRLVLKVSIDAGYLTLACPLQDCRISLRDIDVIQVRRPRWWLRPIFITMFRKNVPAGERYLIQSINADEVSIFQRLIQMLEGNAVAVRSL